MEKVYLDRTEIPGNTAFIFRDAEPMDVGATVYAMSVREKNDEYRRYAEEFDMRFVFSDEVPEVTFFTVPQVDVFAVDSEGGYLGSVGSFFDSENPVCYIDLQGNCYHVSESAEALFANPLDWKKRMQPCKEIEIFRSKELAKQKYALFGKDAWEKLKK